MTGNFNSRPIVLFVGGLLYVVLALFGFRALLGGDIIRFGLVLCLPLLLVFNAMRRYWAGILLGSLSLWTLGAIQLPVIGSLGLSGLLEVIILGFIFLDIAMRKPKIFIYWRGYYTLFALASILILARVIYDRPGMVNFGSGQGGLNIATGYILAFLGFGIGYYVGLFDKSWKTTFRILIAFSILCYIVGDLLLMRGMSDAADVAAMGAYGLSYTRSLYFLFAAAIILSLRKKSQRAFGEVAFVGVVAILLLLAGISSVRSTIIQTGAMVVVAGCLYKKLAVGLGAYLVLGIGAIAILITTIPYQDLPDNIRRPLSMFVNGGNDSARGYGAKDEFREALQEYAAQRLAENPMLGRGWAFKADDLLSAMNLLQGGEENGQLVLTGSFHNSFLTTAVNNGIPTAVICFLAFAVAGWSLLRFARRESDPVTKESISFLLIYCSSMMVMAWLNGGSNELRALAMSLGVASAYRDKRVRQVLEEKKSNRNEVVQGIDGDLGSNS